MGIKWSPCITNPQSKTTVSQGGNWGEGGSCDSESKTGDIPKSHIWTAGGGVVS